MKTASTPHSTWDAIGISASLICAIHCILLPLFLSSLPFLGIELLKNVVFEDMTVLISLVVGSWALYLGYRKKHRKSWPVLLFALGMIALLVSNSLFREQPPEKYLKFLAASCIIVAHSFNWKYTQNCRKDYPGR
jgi:hypothetical protein